jgi:hypothetical protein
MMEVLFAAARDGREAVRIDAIQGLRILAYNGDARAVLELDRALNAENRAVSEAAEEVLFWLAEWATSDMNRMTGFDSKQRAAHPASAGISDVGLRLSARLLKLLESETNRPRPARSLHEPSADPRTEIPGLSFDEVQFTAALPDRVEPGEAFLVDFWVHLEELSADVAQKSREARANHEIRIVSRGPVKLARETVMQVRFAIPDFGTPEIEETVVWLGRLGNASFPVQVPQDASAGRHIGYCNVYVGPLRVTRIYFEVNVGRERGETAMQKLKQTRVQSAFASYATEDRHEVLARMQGMLKIVPDMDIFMDVLTLRSGDHWETRINEEIATRDVFYLFWSVAAIQSRWVEREWRTALVLRGLDHIDPVPLQPPAIAPPPAELSALHFDDWLLAVDGPRNTRT